MGETDSNPEIWINTKGLVDGGSTKSGCMGQGEAFLWVVTSELGPGGVGGSEVPSPGCVGAESCYSEHVEEKADG